MTKASRPGPELVFAGQVVVRRVSGEPCRGGLTVHRRATAPACGASCGRVSDGCPCKKQSVHASTTSWGYIVCKRESERCGRCFRNSVQCMEAPPRRQGSKRQELYRLPTASSGLDPTSPCSDSVAPHSPSRIEPVAVVDAVGWAEQTLRPLRLSISNRTRPLALVALVGSGAPRRSGKPDSKFGRDMGPGRTDRAESPRHHPEWRWTTFENGR